MVISYKERTAGGDSHGWMKSGSSGMMPGRGFTMVSVEVSEKEVSTLVRALESYLPDLRTERVGTDNREWHAELVEQEAILDEILKRLKSVQS